MHTYFYFFLYFQIANDRSGFSDYRTITTYNWTDRGGLSQTTKVVVTVSNWHFNRDCLRYETAPICKLENVMVTLKLASTVFDGNRESTAPLSTSGNSGSPGSTPIKSGQRITATSGEEYHFDKNGAIVPYSAFVSLIDSAEFQEYLEKVKKLYYKEKAASENDDDDDDDDDDEVLFDNIKKVAAAAKKRRATGKRKMKYGKSRRTIDFSSEDDENAEQRAPRSPTPIESGEDSSNRNAEKKVANLPDSDLESEKDQQENEKEQNDKKKEERRTRSSTEARK